MKDVEMMKKCLADAAEIYEDFMGWERGGTKKYVDRVIGVSVIAAGLFNSRSFTCPVTWDDKPEGESDIPF